MEQMKWTPNEMPKTDDAQLSVMSLENVVKARTFHESFPQYSQTPLARLQHMADYLGIKELYVKDESYRFGLNAFKVLGGSFAMARYIAKQTGRDVSALPYNVLTSEELRKEFGQATFFTATDGNHGRGVAWAANKLGQKSVVLMPKGSTKTRLENIRKENAQATIEEVNYDECVRMANALAEKTPNGVMVQDTAWDGYEEIPSWIMQGYGTMAMEADEQLHEYGCERPTHVFIQAGVGSLAGAVQGYFANRYPKNPPKVIVMEASVADCLYKGAIAKDGSVRFVDGDMQTIMAGLACGEPNTISWDILKNHVTAFLSCPDWVSAKGMRMLAAPFKGDPQVVSGESGAVGMGVIASVMQMEEYRALREFLALDENSRVLMFSTEGDTDPDRYKEIVWGGKQYE
ncbi:diaminopropionate ammonia-lyase [Lactonifactor longoviformis]|uniref:Diaminopropionate ammonia-lyase n=1 Tax=Lactonifactor longoviformis DSM 17459 TaxID=1122155 RepID=A0A1M4T5N8_9CLOT|nr:diaminopropionate ammonia-lyase [Lactonifactor longoviformis]POP34595.1 diaminopropionate ammonia-lyase [Lactonifactor longoviformis]SHE39751.1 diaminopropionate ammonia-lyase [Lactonifactor longoviformis DSM 17459]